MKLAAFVLRSHASRLFRITGRISSVEPNAVGLRPGYKNGYQRENTSFG